VLFIISRNADGYFSVDISAYGSSTAGETYSLTCSVTLYPNYNPTLPDPNIPSPMFEWFYSFNGSASLPSSGLIPMTTFNGSTYTSKLEFSPLHQSHTGNYTCRLGAGSLVNSSMLTVTGKYYSIQCNVTVTILFHPVIRLIISPIQFHYSTFWLQ
jgi:hypothetical protein